MKAVFFDIGGVVVDAKLERYFELASGVFGCSDALKEEVVRFVRDLETGKLSSFQFWDAIGRNLMLTGRGRRGRARLHRNLFRSTMADSLVVNRPLLWLCQAMSRNGLIVAAVSNTVEDHAGFLTEHGVYAPFSPCILSCRVGLRKPDPEIYKLALREAGMRGYQCAMVDDNADNLPTAAGVGMATFHYKDVKGLASALHNHRAITGAQYRAFRRFLV